MKKKIETTVKEKVDLLDVEIIEHRKTRIKLAAKERELHDIVSSKSYKMAKIITKIKFLILYPVNLLITLHPRLRYKIAINRKYVKRAYSSPLFLSDLNQEKTAETAIIIHLFYVDMIEYFCEKINKLPNLKYDLFVTIPDFKANQKEFIKKMFPNARVLIVPNCGRDVLPFIEVLRVISDRGYKNVLKLHSKKSPHRKDGSEWRDSIVNNLLPANGELADEIIHTLNKQDTSILGPKGEYVSLLVNFNATSHHLIKIVSHLYDEKIAREIKSSADEYGFFAGTMFWAKIDSISQILDVVKATDFEPEFGQVDSTLAHALERLFTLIPELNNNKIFEVTKNHIKEIDKHTSNIPDWSEIALKPNK